jgi:hypothetical protein
MIAPNWMKVFLKAAGVYNILWGIAVILLPNLVFELAGMQLPIYPMIWQCVGMVIGVYGVGYWVAGNDPLRHYPIVLVGFLGKIFGPIGFAWYVFQGLLPLKWGVVIIFNDLIWWLPFFLILKMAYQNEYKTNTLYA